MEKHLLDYKKENEVHNDKDKEDINSIPIEKKKFCRQKKVTFFFHFFILLFTVNCKAWIKVLRSEKSRF